MSAISANMVVMFDDADEAIARVEDDVRRAQQRAARMSQLQSATAAARGVGRHREVDHTGELTALRIADAALSRGGAGVARLVLDTVRDARADLRRNLLTAAAEVLGDDDPVLDGLRAQLEPSGAAR